MNKNYLDMTEEELLECWERGDFDVACDLDKEDANLTKDATEATTASSEYEMEGSEAKKAIEEKKCPFCGQIIKCSTYKMSPSMKTFFDHLYQCAKEHMIKR